MMEESKTSRSRVAFALLCGLAVCCSVMYVTSDAADEAMLNDVGSGQDVHDPSSVDSTDVLKTGLLYTKTPDTIKKGAEGRQRLLTFLDKVEANIAKEVMSRKSDIASIRQKMAKNMELNAAARKKMKTMLLTRMAKNAKKAKDDLRREMRRVQAKFANVAALENKRHKQTMKRARATREIMRKNKAQGASDLALATLNQQRALATLNQATNARIKKTNSHIAANSAAIKANAKKARQDLDNEMNKFDHKMNNVESEAKKGRSKLAAQANAQDKKFREYANKRIKAITAKTAASFRKVRATMAKDRSDADAAITHTSSRMNAALAAQRALQNKRFASTVSDIAAAKKEANDRVAGFRAGFKTDILKLSGVAEEQTKKLNQRVTQLSGTVTNNKLEQSKVNNAVDKELKRLVGVGNKRYDAHLKKDKELHALMKSNKDDTQKKMTKMATDFNDAISKIKKQMAKDRAHHEKQLGKSSTALYKTLMDNKVAQDKTNTKLTAATRRAELDAQAALKEAKQSFAKRIGVLTKTVVGNEKKVNKKMLKLTGIVEKNAIKDAQGRAQLSKISAFNKNQINIAVRDAIHKGEQRALQIEKKMKGINAKNRKDLNTRITTEIGTLRKQIHGQVLGLQLETKEARAQMKKQLMFAIDSEAKLAAQNLKKAVAWSEGEFSKMHNNLASEKKLSTTGRASLKASVIAEKKIAVSLLDNAVAAQAKAMLAYKNEMCNNLGSEDIKDCPKATRGKMNKRLDGEAARMMANAKMVQQEMKTQTAAINNSLEKARKAAQAELAATSASSVKRYNAVMKAVEDGVSAARKKANGRFTEVQVTMAKDKATADRKLGAATVELNDAIAKAAALEDTRFKKTVKDLRAAKKAAADDVKNAKKNYITQIAVVKATAKAVGSRILGEIQDVSAMIVSDRAAQNRINKDVDGEITRILKLSDDHESKNTKARGVILKIMNENKRIAHQETKNLGIEARATLALVDSEQNALVLGFKQDLTSATRKVYRKLAADGTAQAAANTSLNAGLTGAKAATATALKQAKANFKSRINTLTNVVTANQRSYEKKLAHATGVVTGWKSASTADRKLIRSERSIMKTKLNAKIVRAIQLGEAQMKAVEERAMENIATEKKTLMTTISVSVENMADNIFAAVQGNRQKTADNYLSLKAYAMASADKIADYLQKGKGRNLSSIGDLLNTLATDSEKPKMATGVGDGSKSVKDLFSGKSIKVSNSITKINGLVNQYVSNLAEVKDRWPMGLGKYLLAKFEIAMQEKGALEVDKIEGKAGNYVFMNGHACGLSSRLSDFEGLAVPMNLFEQTLAKLTATQTFGHKKLAATKISVSPPEWQGN